MVTGFSPIMTDAKSFIEKYWKLISILAVIISTIVGTTWYVAYETIVKPRDLIIEQQRKEIDDLKEIVFDRDLNIEKLEREIDPNNRTRLLPNFSLKIMKPKNGDKVSISTIVRGTLLGELQKEWYMWVIINPRNLPGLWWPQSKRIEHVNEQWSAQTWVGDTSFFHTNKEFYIAIVLVNKTDDKFYSEYLKKGAETGDYPGLQLPDSAIIVDTITVMKE